MVLDAEVAETTARRIRREHGHTLEDVAVAIGITKGHLSRIERNYHGMSLKVAFALADYYGVSIERLFPELRGDAGA
jgi:transcriptional regulator with XRE-family HTH domain